MKILLMRMVFFDSLLLNINKVLINSLEPPLIQYKKFWRA